jgi:S1-C subfamily serine protease
VDGQVGGALVSASNELIGINLPVINSVGVVEGYAVPSHVILHAFNNKVKFTVGSAIQQK